MMKPIAEESRAKVTALYDAAAPTYNRIGPSFFLHFGRRLAIGAGIANGSNVLDLATGTGAVLVPAAELVGDEGRVVGIDISSLMIGRARTEIQKYGFCNADVLVADAESLPFPQRSFDHVLCSFAIFLFSNLPGVISECHRVLRSSGRIGLVYSAGEDQEWTWYEQLISRYEPTANLGIDCILFCYFEFERVADNASVELSADVEFEGIVVDLNNREYTEEDILKAKEIAASRGNRQARKYLKEVERFYARERALEVASQLVDLAGYAEPESKEGRIVFKPRI